VDRKETDAHLAEHRSDGAELEFTLIDLKNYTVFPVLLYPAFQDSSAAKAKVGYQMCRRILFAPGALFVGRQGRHGQLLAKLLLLRPALAGNDFVAADKLQRHLYTHGFTPWNAVIMGKFLAAPVNFCTCVSIFSANRRALVPPAAETTLRQTLSTDFEGITNKTCCRLKIKP
jgi:hypothetical protein